MPDNFTNARPYFDVTFPSSGDSFSIQGFRNAFAGLGFLDHIPLQPRAHNPANLSIMVRGQDASQFYNPVYFGNADQRIPFSSGDTTNFNVPVSNPRIDIVYITPSGDYKIQQGTEAVTPTLPSLGPSGDTRFPIAAIYCKVGMTKVVNFEDKDSNSGDGYIYKDIRPWMRAANVGGVSLASVNSNNATGDNLPGVSATAARSDHDHQGVHSVKVSGSGDLFGDVTLNAPTGFLSQAGNRITFSPELINFHRKEISNIITVNASIPIDNSKPQISEGVTVMSESYACRNVNNRLMIVAETMAANGSANLNVVLALFKNSEVNAIGAICNEQGSTSPEPISLPVYLNPIGTTASILYELRAGSDGTSYLNADGSGIALFAGLAITALNFYEYAPAAGFP